MDNTDGKPKEIIMDTERPVCKICMKNKAAEGFVEVMQ